MNDGPAYVVRSTTRAPAGRVTYELVDMAGKVSHVTIARELSTPKRAEPVLTYAVGRPWTRPRSSS